jgi:hypothetical protein
MRSGLPSAQWFKTLHCSARGVPTDPGSNPGCVAAGRGQETHEAAHNWPSVVRVEGGFGRPGCPCPIAH